MWFRKKEVKDKLVPIRTRLQRLGHCFLMFDMNTPKTIVQEEDNDTIVFFFKSNLGTVKITYTWSSLGVAIAEDIFILSYENYAGTTVFEITSKSEYSTEVVPMLDENFGAHEIDLALLELETYLYETFGDIETQYQEYLKEQKRKKEYHVQQINILEGK